MERHEKICARRWMLILASGVVCLFVGVIIQLVRLHIVRPGYEPPDYTAKYNRLGLRGSILDRNGIPLAESLPGRIIFIDPQDPKLNSPLVDRDTLPLDIATVTKVPQEEVIQAFRRTESRYVRIADTADETVISEITRRRSAKTDRFAGIGMTEREIRAYPNGSRLCHVLGYVNAEGEGVYGIEQRCQEELKGQDGHVKTSVDARRREIRSLREEDVPAVPGNDVWLTIDNNIQYILEEALSGALTEFNADSGIIVVQRVKTGEILGMATLPSFNPQHYGSVTKNLWKNIAVSRNYEPGSIMKVITVASALQQGVITPKSTFDVGTAGIWYYAGKPLRDHAYGIIDVKTLLAKSSNIGTAMIGLRLAEPAPGLGFPHEYERLWHCFRAFGFGQRTGIELPGEEAGILHHWRSWNKLSPTRMTLGQGIAVTAVQMANAYATIANGGLRMQPYLIRRVTDSEGNLIRETAPRVLGRPISKKVCAQMLEMMQAVTDPKQGGTARRAALEDYTVAGKTGTGQIPSNGRYNNTDYTASFVGIYPATAPELVILISIEKPKGRLRQGGSVAAPVFARIAGPIGRYLGIPSDKPKDTKKGR